MAYTTIDKPTDYFSTNLWVADDSSPRSFTGFGHQPDFVWVKHRGSANINHTLVDSVRGGDKMLFSNTTAAEDTKSHGEITSFDSDGITVADGTNATYPRLYFNDLDPFGAGGGNYVGWSWLAGGTASSNTDGSITSTVSANTTAGFSIVSYTGTGSNATVGHGLGVAPKVVLIKNRDGVDVWVMQHGSLADNEFLEFNNTSAKQTDSARFNGTAPTSSVFSVGTSGTTNGNTEKFIAYCFAEKKGYSKFGSYTGNGNADGSFIFTGFKPAWVMIKRTDSADNWVINDNKRLGYNVDNNELFANLINTEDTNDVIDLLSNGFKLRHSAGRHNNSGGNYIYMCFAENPFVTAGTKAAGTAR